MFSTLLETKRKKQRNVASSLMSATMHLLLVTGAVYASAKPPESERAPDERQTFTEIKLAEDPPPPKQPDNPPPPDAPPRPKGPPALSIVVNIPTTIPTIDVLQRPTNETLWDVSGIRGGSIDGDPKVKTVRLDSTYFVADVDKAARLSSGPEPNYPSILKQTRQTGSVRVQFVIDTLGKADMSTLKVVETSNSLFFDEVKKVLPKYEFVPAQIGARKVRMEAILPFEFKLDPKGGGSD